MCVLGLGQTKVFQSLNEIMSDLQVSTKLKYQMFGDPCYELVNFYWVALKKFMFLIGHHILGVKSEAYSLFHRVLDSSKALSIDKHSGRGSACFGSFVVESFLFNFLMHSD